MIIFGFQIGTLSDSVPLYHLQNSMCSSIHVFNYDKKASDFGNPGYQTHELTQLPTYPPMTGRFFLVDGGGWMVAGG